MVRVLIDSRSGVSGCQDVGLLLAYGIVLWGLGWSGFGFQGVRIWGWGFSFGASGCYVLGACRAFRAWALELFVHRPCMRVHEETQLESKQKGKAKSS